jgi:hypothetical protein
VAKSKRKLFKKWSVWYDTFLFEEYVVLDILGEEIRIMWMKSNSTSEINILYCKYDKFVRFLSSLEKELL